MRLITTLNLAIDYLRYYFTAGNAYDIHSPFVFNLYNKAICIKDVSPKFFEVENLRTSLLKNKTEITFTDLGAGSLTGANKVRRVCEIAASSAKNKKYATLLYRLCNYLNAQTVIELGTSLGISTAYMSSANPKKIYTIEGCDEVSQLTEENLGKLNFQNINFITGSFDEQLPKLLSSIQSFDLVFIDGNHQYQPTINYFTLLLEKSNENSCFIFDDINWSNEMKTAWKEICENTRTTVSIDLFFMGIVFVNPNLSKQHFVLRY